MTESLPVQYMLRIKTSEPLVKYIFFLIFTIKLCSFYCNVLSSVHLIIKNVKPVLLKMWAAN